MEETTLRGRDIIPASRFRPQETWVEVVRRRPGRTTTAVATAAGTASAVRPSSLPARREAGSRVKPQKPPNSSAVTLTCPPGKYEATMRTAKSSIKPEDMDITRMHFKRAVTGALTMEIPGDKDGKKASALAERLTALFAGNEEIRVARPIKTAELRVKDLDDSVTAGEVSGAVAESGGCPAEEVRAGAVSRAPNGLGTVWVRCPLTAANKIAAMGRIRVGWASARVELLGVRPLQCFRCLEGGHVRRNCPSSADRSGRCYRCGAEGHIARECRAPPKCPVCADLGLPANHRAGSKACGPSRRKRRGGLAPPTPPTSVEVAVPAAATTTKRSGDPGSSGEGEAPRRESPRPQRTTKKRKTEIPPSATGESEVMELEDSAEYTQ